MNLFIPCGTLVAVFITGYGKSTERKMKAKYDARNLTAFTTDIVMSGENGKKRACFPVGCLCREHVSETALT